MLEASSIYADGLEAFMPKASSIYADGLEALMPKASGQARYSNKE
jgi:hypothetical protein